MTTPFRRSTPVDTLQTDWLSLTDELERGAERLREAENLIIQFRTEQGMMTEELDRIRAELGFWRSYALQIETKLEVITGIITEARDTARKAAKSHAQTEIPRQEPVIARTETIVDRAREVAGHHGNEPESFPEPASPVLRARNGSEISVNRLRDLPQGKIDPYYAADEQLASILRIDPIAPPINAYR